MWGMNAVPVDFCTCWHAKINRYAKVLLHKFSILAAYLVMPLKRLPVGSAQCYNLNAENKRHAHLPPISPHKS